MAFQTQASLFLIRASTQGCPSFRSFLSSPALCQDPKGTDRQSPAPETISREGDRHDTSKATHPWELGWERKSQFWDQIQGFSMNGEYDQAVWSRKIMEEVWTDTVVTHGMPTPKLVSSALKDIAKAFYPEAYLIVRDACGCSDVHPEEKAKDWKQDVIPTFVFKDQYQQVLTRLLSILQGLQLSPVYMSSRL
ncbi:hypothetical protein STEG23_013817 [Scotinomys teguina]